MTSNFGANPNRYWWHAAIAKELAIVDGHCTKGLAQNVRESWGDCERHCNEMIEWGELVEVEPIWDTAGVDVGKWIKLAEG